MNLQYIYKNSCLNNGRITTQDQQEVIITDCLKQPQAFLALKPKLFPRKLIELYAH